MEAADPTKVAGVGDTVVQDSSGDAIPLDASTLSSTWGLSIYDIALYGVVAISVGAVVVYVISRSPPDPPYPPALFDGDDSMLEAIPYSPPILVYREPEIQHPFQIGHPVPLPGLLQALEWLD